MKLLKMGAAAVAIVSTIALTGCSGGSWFDSGDEPVIVTITEVKEGQGVTQAQAPQSKEPQKAAVSEVSADSILSPTGGVPLLSGWQQAQLSDSPRNLDLWWHTAGGKLSDQ